MAPRWGPRLGRLHPASKQPNGSQEGLPSLEESREAPSRPVLAWPVTARGPSHSAAGGGHRPLPKPHLVQSVSKVSTKGVCVCVCVCVCVYKSILCHFLF